MDSSRISIDRRAFLRASGATAAAATGLFATTGQAVADGHECPCHQCWLDIKPGSCPNSINPGSQGVVSVAAGWAGLDPETVKLIPREEAWGDCSERRADYTTPDPDCETVEGWASIDSGYATPVRAERTNVDGDDDDDWVYKFDTQELDLEEGIQSAVLVGRDAQSGCPVWGVDSINIVGGNDGRGSENGNGPPEDGDRGRGRSGNRGNGRGNSR